jgi:hypothetical protein
VRQRCWLVERAGPYDRLNALDLACVEDDGQGERLSALWEAEPDARVLHDEHTESPARSPEPTARFAAYLHTLRWACVTSSNPTLLQAPRRAGIDAPLSVVLQWHDELRQRCGLDFAVCNLAFRRS